MVEEADEQPVESLIYQPSASSFLVAPLAPSVFSDHNGHTSTHLSTQNVQYCKYRNALQKKYKFTIFCESDIFKSMFLANAKSIFGAIFLAILWIFSDFLENGGFSHANQL
jgi:hypothetical protein